MNKEDITLNNLNDFIWIGTNDEFEDLEDYDQDVMYIILEEEESNE